MKTKLGLAILVILIGCVAVFFPLSSFKKADNNVPPIAQEDSRINNKEAIRELVLRYTADWAEAVNKNDFSLAEKYLLPDSELFKSQKDLQNTLKQSGARLQLIKTDIGDISFLSDQGIATITVLEEYNVSFSGGERKVSRCYWTYSANYVQGQGWKLSKIVETPASAFAFDGPVVVLQEYNQEWIRLQYPQIEKMPVESVQAKINDVFKKLTDEFGSSMRAIVEHGKKYPNYGQYEAKSSYTVKWQTTDTLSIAFYTYTFTGGAHGISSETGYTFDLKTGDLITLRDRVGDEKIRVYNDMILQQIRARNIPIFEPYKGISDQTTYYLKDAKTLVVAFQQYEIAPYSSGILRFELPY